MAIADTALTTVELASRFVGISSLSTEEYTVFEALINAVSASVSNFCGRVFGKVSGVPSYTELLSASHRQLLILTHFPIVSVTSVESDGVALVLDTDYRCDPQDKERGVLYKESGWKGSVIVSGLTSNVVASERNIEVEYVAGYVLPGDPAFLPGAEGTLPYEIIDTVNAMVAEKYYQRKRESYGLTSLSEGGVSYSFGKTSALANDGSLEAMTLNRYKRWL